MAIEVTLTLPELLMAANLGVLRQLEALRKHLPDKHGFKEDEGWGVHIEGAAGEMAVAKALDRYYSGTLNTFRTQGDVGALEVRTRSKDYYELLVRPSDADDAVFILVCGKAPTYRVVGWIRGKDAKNEVWLRTHGNRPAAYFVPQSELNRFEAP